MFVVSEATPLLRASTLLHVSGLIGCLMQTHVGFLMMWTREGGRTRWLLREAYRLKLRTTRSFTHHCRSSCCHATHNIPFFSYHKFRHIGLLRDNKNDNLLQRLSIESSQDDV